jgi:hypothetical protein
MSVRSLSRYFLVRFFRRFTASAQAILLISLKNDDATRKSGQIDIVIVLSESADRRFAELHFVRKIRGKILRFRHNR